MDFLLLHVLFDMVRAVSLAPDGVERTLASLQPVFQQKIKRHVPLEHWPP